MAFERLNLTQSTVSHAIKKLRLTFGDPLFVRSGRGIMPTERARSLREQVMEIVDSMKRLSDERAFDPTGQPLRFRVAANDLTRDLLFPAILSDASKSGIDLFLMFMPSCVPPATLLYDSRCDLIVTPLPPDGLDIIQQKLFEGEMACFCDSPVRRPPSTREEYKNDKHIMVRFADGRSSFNVVSEVDRAELSDPVVSVSYFGAIPGFVNGSNLIATEMQHMALGPLKDLDRAPFPFPCNSVSIFMVCHRRDSTDPAHRRLQEQDSRSAEVLKGMPPR